jgi:hypothetical protein
MMKKWFCVMLLLGVVSTVPPSRAQGLPDQLNFIGSNFEGFQFYGVSTFLNYAHHQFPLQAGSTATSVRDRANFGVSGTVGWQRFHGKFNASARYTGGYSGDALNTTVNHMNHNATFNASRTLGKKWTVDFFGNAQVVTIEQYIFQPSALGNISLSQPTAADLAAAMSIGQFSNSQAGLQLGGAMLGYAPNSAALLGYHLLIYGTQASISYQHSSRLSFSLASLAAGGQHLSGSDIVRTNYAVPKTLGGNFGVTMDYALTPRTEISVSGLGNYTRSTYQRAVAAGGTFSISRKMSTHWFVRATGGATRMETIDQVAGHVPAMQSTYGGSLGYRARTHTFVGSFLHSGYDQSTGMIGSNNNTQAAWSWRDPRRSWGLGALYSRNVTTSTGFSELYGWRVQATYTQSLPMNLVMTASFSYLNSRGLYLNLPNEVHVDGARIALGWVPNRRRMTSQKIDIEE